MSKLRTYQEESVTKLVEILRTHRSAVDLSDCGTGKTYVACAVASALQLPTLIVVPKISITDWQRVAAYLDDRFSIIGYEKLRAGNTPYGWWDKGTLRHSDNEYFVCQVCQQRFLLETSHPCSYHPLGIHCVTIKRKPRHQGNFNFAPAIGMVIFDEVHRCGGLDSLNEKMLVAAWRQKKVVLGLSATMACSPLRMKALGYVLGLHSLSEPRERLNAQLFSRGRPCMGFYRWAGQFKCRFDRRFGGFKWFAGRDCQAGIMRQIRDLIIPSRGVRVAVDEIPGFPRCNTQAKLLDLGDSTKVDKLYAKMAAAISELRAKKSSDCAPDHPLTVMLRTRQEVELLKVPAVVELTQDLQEKGYSVAIFVNFRQTLQELCGLLKTDCFIDGSVEGVKYRHENIDAFQSNSKREIICVSEAGGFTISLQDLTGLYPRAGIVLPGFSATTLRQVLGRLPREGAKTVSNYYVVFAANTIEEKIYRNLVPKLNNLDALNDGDLMPENLKICV